MAMKKTMVYLPDEIHEGLRRLAFDRRVSMAELIRRAVEAAYGEVLEDIRDAEEELAGYLTARPAS
jgi:Arc/MetJ-type ribon-helix-helix transcriptional regulator